MQIITRVLFVFLAMAILTFAMPAAAKDCSKPGVKCGKALKRAQMRIRERRATLTTVASAETPEAMSESKREGKRGGKGDRKRITTVCAPANEPLKGAGLEDADAEALARFSRQRNRYDHRVCVVACWQINEAKSLVGDIFPPEVYTHFNIGDSACAAAAKQSACAQNKGKC